MSGISLWENFVGTDWARYSAISSKVSCVICVMVSLIYFIFGLGLGTGIFSTICALMLAVWEFPFVFALIPGFEQANQFLLDRVLIKYEETKSGLCFILCIFCFYFSSLSIVEGVCLLMSSILYGFAAVNRHVDEEEGTVTPNYQIPYQSNTQGSIFTELLRANNQYSAV